MPIGFLPIILDGIVNFDHITESTTTPVTTEIRNTQEDIQTSYTAGDSHELGRGNKATCWEHG